MNEAKTFYFKCSKDFIEPILVDDDIDTILSKSLKDLFDQKDLMEIHQANAKKKKFFEKFEAINNDKKYLEFSEAANSVCEWIPNFKLLNNADTNEIIKKCYIMYNLFHIFNEDIRENLQCFDKKLIKKLQLEDQITEKLESELLAILNSKGHYHFASHLIFNLPLKKVDCYSMILKIFWQNKTDFIKIIHPELNKELEKIDNKKDIKVVINGYVEALIDLTLKIDEKMNENSKKDSNIQMDHLEDSNSVISLSKSDYEEITNELFEEGKKPLDKESFNLNELKAKGAAAAIAKLKLHKPSESNNDSDSDDESENSDKSFDVDSECDEDMDELYGLMAKKKVKELISLHPCQDESNPNSNGLEMREYQKELAKNGIEGKNVLICAPTGSGKTIVAVKIVQEHLEKNKEGKVAFLVHRVALVDQQSKQFRKYLGDYKITQLTGTSKSTPIPLVGQLPNFQIFVLTSDILRNSLETNDDTKLPNSIREFTLILFDECHNCDKKHPYNRIMTHYYDEKRKLDGVIEKSSLKLPQIVGLTASTGTNKAKTMDKAMKRLYELCANLDTEIVSTVKQSKDELDAVTSKPTEEIITTSSRVNDEFEVKLQDAMNRCENYFVAMRDRDYFETYSDLKSLYAIPKERTHQKYHLFVNQLGSDLQNNTKKDHAGPQSISVISMYLKVYVRALMVNHLFRAVDAIELIKKEINADAKYTCRTDRLLRKNLAEICRYPELSQTKNPSLEKLKEIIKEQLTKKEDSRIIVFVRERIYTQILKKIFDEEEVTCDVIAGNQASASEGGLTQNRMAEVLENFRAGIVRVLFSTTVAEEGLDVETCNLVIRYGHVTNETAMVQSRGRARARDSKYIVIVPNVLSWQVNKENINKYREEMMYKAILKFQSLPEKEVKENIENFRVQRQIMEATSRPKQKKRIVDKSIWTFFCKRCNKKIFTSDDIRIANNTSRILFNIDTYKNLVLDDSTKQQTSTIDILCKKCHSFLCVRIQYRNLFFPVPKLELFVVRCEEAESAQSFKRWKDVPFDTKDVTYHELSRFNNDHPLSK